MLARVESIVWRQRLPEARISAEPGTDAPRGRITEVRVIEGGALDDTERLGGDVGAALQAVEGDQVGGGVRAGPGVGDVVADRADGEHPAAGGDQVLVVRVARLGCVDDRGAGVDDVDVVDAVGRADAA